MLYEKTVNNKITYPSNNDDTKGDRGSEPQFGVWSFDHLSQMA